MAHGRYICRQGGPQSATLGPAEKLEQISCRAMDPEAAVRARPSARTPSASSLYALCGLWGRDHVGGDLASTGPTLQCSTFSIASPPLPKGARARRWVERVARASTRAVLRCVIDIGALLPTGARSRKALGINAPRAAHSTSGHPCRRARVRGCMWAALVVAASCIPHQGTLVSGGAFCRSTCRALGINAPGGAVRARPCRAFTIGASLLNGARVRLQLKRVGTPRCVAHSVLGHACQRARLPKGTLVWP